MMETLMVGATVAGSFAAAFVVQKVLLGMWLKAISTKREPK